MKPPMHPTCHVPHRNSTAPPSSFMKFSKRGHWTAGGKLIGELLQGGDGMAMGDGGGSVQQQMPQRDTLSYRVEKRARDRGRDRGLLAAQVGRHIVDKQTCSRWPTRGGWPAGWWLGWLHSNPRERMLRNRRQLSAKPWRRYWFLPSRRTRIAAIGVARKTGAAECSKGSAAHPSIGLNWGIPAGAAKWWRRDSGNRPEDDQTATICALKEDCHTGLVHRWGCERRCRGRGVHQGCQVGQGKLSTVWIGK